MSETPMRTAPAPDVSRLLKSEQTAAPSAPAVQVEEAAGPTPPAAAPERQAHHHGRLAERPTSPRAAFTATRSLEADASFSGMVTKALEAEAIRRATEHEAGPRHAGASSPPAAPAG